MRFKKMNEPIIKTAFCIDKTFLTDVPSGKRVWLHIEGIKIPVCMEATNRQAFTSEQRVVRLFINPTVGFSHDEAWLADRRPSVADKLFEGVIH